MPTIVITGGHHNSALVVAQELQKKGFHVVWFGHRFASRGNVHDSAEYLEITAAKIPFYHLKAGKIDSTPTFAEIANIPLGFFRAWRLLRQIKPTAVLSFGGYLGLAVALPAHFLSIPLYLHEQTMRAGRANQLAGHFARCIFVAWERALKYFPPEKSLYVGLPLRPQLMVAKSRQLFPNHLPSIVVLGGKLGSHTINTHLFALLPNLLTHYNLVHQTGLNSVTQDYEAALALKNALPANLSDHYLPVGYLGENEIGTYLQSCDLYLGRSGAHITYELAYLGRRSLLIPFMHTTGSEQYFQAKYLAESGNAIILPQSELSSTTLRHNLLLAFKLPRAHPLPVPTSATTTMVNRLVTELA